MRRLLCYTTLALFGSLAMSRAQSVAGSHGSMDGVTPQRTHAYDAQDIIATPAKTLWRSDKLFTLKPYDFEKFENGPFRFEVAIPNYHRYSTPVLADGALYFTVYNGSGYILGLSSKDGTPRQRNKVETALSAPTVVGGVLYVGGGNGKNKVMYAVHAATGQEKWQYKILQPVAEHPIIADGTIYFLDIAAYLHAVR